MSTGDTFYMNEMQVYKLSSISPEYQYFLKDHLGNMRLTFTASPGTDVNTATYETASRETEEQQFIRFSDARVITSALLDHTNGSASGNAQRLNGSQNEKYGLGKSLSVMPGDVVSMEVYGKYIDTNSSNWTSALTTLMGQISSHTTGVVTDGINYSSSTNSFPGAYNSLVSKSPTSAPHAYLNWLIFDKNYTFITGGYKQITTAAKESGSDVAHERIHPDADLTITQPGYVYIYVSNEEPNPVEVYFDDFNVTRRRHF